MPSMGSVWKECERVCRGLVRDIVKESLEADIRVQVGVLCVRIGEDQPLMQQMNRFRRRSPWLWLKMRDSESTKGCITARSAASQKCSKVRPSGASEHSRGRTMVVDKHMTVLAGEEVIREQPFAIVGRQEGLESHLPDFLRILLIEECPWTLSLALLALFRVRALPPNERAPVMSLESHIQSMKGKRLIKCMCQASLAVMCLQDEHLDGMSTQEAAWELLLMLARCHTNSIAITALKRDLPTSPADIGCGAVLEEGHCLMGAALYPLVSLVNHSCIPTATVEFDGTEAVVR